MRTLRAIVSEIVHLFVDDGSLAVGLVVWCAVVGGVGLRLPGLLPVAGPALFLGCAGILLGTVVWAARGSTGSRNENEEALREKSRPETLVRARLKKPVVRQDRI